ncbi:MAG: heparinase II/III family protein [Nitrosomonadales bacterium]|nr:heparinase II/III family protein [Nitrosomonadales bacterium]
MNYVKINKLAWIIRQLRTPPDQLQRKIMRRLEVAGRQRVNRWKGRLRSTFLQTAPVGSLARCVRVPEKSDLAGISQELAQLAGLYLEHRFDLLGSGWVKVVYGRECIGFGGHQYSARRYPECDATGKWLSARINPANLSEAQRIWQLVNPGYEPIDWQLDFKSGYRWKDSAWHLDIEIPSDCPGADIKVPWELARCQHLPQLALAYAAGTCGLLEDKERYAREFRNQVLDFLANNPPGFGVNWRCTMDVAIRITNWLIAYDLFAAADARFDDDFDALFLRSAREHALHIAGNLEWSESGRSNHYLSNVVGLLAVAAYLPRTIETDAWSGWALRELVLEVEGQFDGDGCNREGSTSYHRLSAEMVIYGTAFARRLLQGRLQDVTAGMRRVPGLSGWGGRPQSVLARIVQDLSAGDLPSWYWHRLYGMGRFVAAITKPDGRVPQVGDNDSGRFLKIEPVMDRLTVASARERYAHLGGYCELPDGAIYPSEVVLDHRHLFGALAAFFDDSEFSTLGSEHQLEAGMLGAIAGSDGQRSMQAATVCRIGRAGDLNRYIGVFDKTPATHRQHYEFALPDEDALGQLSAVGFAEFGIFVLRGSGFYAAFRCGPAAQYGQGSHLHHDQLSLELVIGGENIALDPGSYVYTPLPASRNTYRSLRAHFAPWPAIGNHDSPEGGLFVFQNNYLAECLYFYPDGMVGRHFRFGGPAYRMVSIEGNRLVVRDFSESAPIERCPFEGQPPRFTGMPFSDRYGGLLR